MARRRNIPTPKQSLPSNARASADHTLNQLTANVIFSLPREFTLQDILQDCIDSETRCLLALAKEVSCELITSNHKYPVLPNVTFTVANWKSHGMMPSRIEFMHVDTYVPVVRWAMRVQEIMDRFGKVRHVLNWLDDHATLGAIGYYWPTIFGLLSADHHHVIPTHGKFKDCPSIAALIPMIRETAGIVAAAALAPKHVAGDRVMEFQFQGVNATANEIEYIVPFYDVSLSS